MQTQTLPLHKNPAWINMAGYASFSDALAAMRFYEARYARRQQLTHNVRQFALNMLNRAKAHVAGSIVWDKAVFESRQASH